VANKVSVILEVVGDKATSTMKSFTASIKDADGAAGKFKAGAGAAMDSVKANAGNLAMAGGAALIAFGAKAVSAFQDTALAAGEMRDALGLTAEEASQYIEVADDLGIGSDKLQAAMGRMLVTAEKTPAALDSIGASLVKNADGTTNVNKSFQNVVDKLNAIPDASQRAAAAQKIFGKGWQDMAELIEMGGKGIQEALDAVEGGKVIDDAEIERARKFRDSLDALKGITEELTVTVGGHLVPALTTAADAAIGLKNAAKGLGDILGPVDNALFKVVKTSYDFLNPVGQAIKLFGMFSDETEKSTETSNAWVDAIVRVRQISETSTRSWRSATSSYNQSRTPSKKRSRRTTRKPRHPSGQ
jgi:hypothetical protein